MQCSTIHRHHLSRHLGLPSPSRALLRQRKDLSSNGRPTIQPQSMRARHGSCCEIVAPQRMDCCSRKVRALHPRWMLSQSAYAAFYCTVRGPPRTAPRPRWRHTLPRQWQRRRRLAVMRDEHIAAAGTFQFIQRRSPHLVRFNERVRVAGNPITSPTDFIAVERERMRSNSSRRAPQELPRLTGQTCVSNWSASRTMAVSRSTSSWRMTAARANKRE